jgi:hypothetical protein
MRHLKISALLSVVGVMTIAGVGNSAPNKAARVRMMDFDGKAETLAGYPGAGAALGYFRRLQNTAHLPGVGGPMYPPNPCNPLISIYNKIITKVPEGPGRRIATRAVLGAMARRQCCVDTVWDGSVDETQDAAPTFSLRPVACDP